MERGGAPGSWATSTRQPAVLANQELAPQLLQASGPLSFTVTGGGSTALEFDDWPATIGIDNLKLTGAPEPAGFLLLGTLVAGLFFLNRKKKQAL